MAGLQQSERQIRGACALDCPDTCSWIVTVKGCQPVSLRGDPHHPFTRGSLCNKVADYLTYVRSSDRQLYPLCRVGPKGSGELTRISWDEALERIAAGLGDPIKKQGAEAIWPFLGSASMGLPQGVYGAGRRLWNVLGASRHSMNICRIAGGFGTGYTLGDNRVGMDPETLRSSKLVVLWGANVLSTNPHLWRPILEARKRGAKVVAIDPIRIRTAAASDYHLAPVPGTDAALALALGLLHVVLAEGRENRDEVSVANARGSIFAVAYVSDRIRPGVVATTKGRWPGHSKQGSTINATVDEHDSDMGSGAVSHDNRVRIDRLS